MKKILMLIAVVLVIAAPTFAKNVFSDVPSDHWAYSALSQLEANGFVVGFPDGEYKGKRNLTRYEFAMVLAKLLPFLKDDELKVDSFVLKSEIGDYVKKGDINLNLYAKSSDLDILVKLLNEFKPELAQLGVDVNAVTADVNVLKTKVAALEAEQQRVVITGELNIMGKAAYGVKDTRNGSDTDNEGLTDYDGRVINKGSSSIKLYKDFQLDIKGKVSNSINAYMTLVAGDYLNRINAFDKVDNSLEVKPYYLYATMDWNKYGDAKLGLMPYQINKYVYQRHNDNRYFDVKRLSDGNYQTEGASYFKDFGPVDLNAWFMKPEYNVWDDTTYYYGFTASENNYYRSYGMLGTINYMAGLQLGIDISTAKLDVLYNYSRSNAKSMNKSNIYGGILNIPFGSVNFDTAYMYQKAKDSKKGDLFDANLALDWKGLKVSAGYLQVGANYLAPANYEAITDYVNPNNIKGWKAAASYDWGRFNINVAYKDYKAKDKDLAEAVNSIDSSMLIGDKLKYGAAGIAYNTGSWGTFGFKWENAKADATTKNYYTLDWKKVSGKANYRLGFQRVENKTDELSVETANKGNLFFGQFGYSF